MTESSRIDPDLFFDLTSEDGRPVLAVADDGLAPPLTLALRNCTGRAHLLEMPPPGTSLGPEWYHFSLAFRHGVLSETTLSMLAGEDAATELLGAAAAACWSIACPDPGPGAPVVIYFLLIASPDAPEWTLHPEPGDAAGLGPITLNGITAQPMLAGQGTRVQVQIWAIAPEGDTGHRTPFAMTRRIAIVHPRRVSAVSAGLPLELTLVKPFAIPVIDNDSQEAECWFMLRNVSDSDCVLRGILQCAIKLASFDSKDPYTLCPPGGLCAATWFGVASANGDQQIQRLKRVDLGIDAIEVDTLRWQIPLPEDGLPPGATIRLNANLPSEAEEPLDIVIEYDLERFGAGRRIFTFMRAKPALNRDDFDVLKQQFEAIKKQVNLLASQLWVPGTSQLWRQGLQTGKGSASCDNLKTQENGSFCFTHVIDKAVDEALATPGYPLVERILFSADGYCVHGGLNPITNTDWRLKLSTPYRSSGRPYGERHFYSCKSYNFDSSSLPRFESIRPVVFEATVGSCDFSLIPACSTVASGVYMIRVLLSHLLGPYLSPESAKSAASDV